MAGVPGGGPKGAARAGVSVFALASALILVTLLFNNMRCFRASIGPPYASQDTQTAAAAFHSPEAWRQSVLSEVAGHCPAWFREYERFHASKRGSPDAKYLVVNGAGMGGGIGDRMRGMLHSVRLAVASQRVVLFTWPDMDLTNFVDPPGPIDWRLNGTPAAGAAALGAWMSAQIEWGDSKPDARLLDGSYRNITHQLLVIKDNQCINSECPGCPPLSAMGRDTACVWSRLFELRPDIMAAAHTQLRALNTTPGGYLSMHLRFGGMAEESEETHSGTYKDGRLPNHFHRFLTAVECAARLPRQHNISGALPVLLATDHHRLRDVVAAGSLLGVVSPLVHAVHSDKPHDAATHKTSFVDLALIAMGRCVVLSPALGWPTWQHCVYSGFSHQGFLMGGARTCHAMYMRC